VERAFFPDGAPEAFRDLLTPLYQMEGALTFAASVEGKMVACGAGLVIPEHRIFAVCGAGTSAEFRGAVCRRRCFAPPGCRSRSRLRVCRGGDAGRHSLTAQLRANGVSCGLQQGDVDEVSQRLATAEIAEDAERKRVIRSIWPPFLCVLSDLGGRLLTMKVDEIREFCLAFPEAKENLQWGDDLCFKIGGKIFTIVGLDNPRLCFQVHAGDFCRTDRAQRYSSGALCGTLQMGNARSARCCAAGMSCRS